MDALRALAERVVLDPRFHDVLAVLKAARNGAVYGTKVRFPHALVVIILFRSGTLRNKLRLVARATRLHAYNLAAYAVVYKLCLILLKQFGPNAGKEGHYDTFLAGLVGGYVVFARRSKRTGRVPAVTQQIVIYIFARVALGLARLAVQPGRGLPLVSREPVTALMSRHAWSAFAALSWAMVMYLFRWHAELLQPSLRSSMDYIYVQSEHWDSMRNLLLYNK